ncbi:hypothetical protein BAE44_0020195 [Dichanthelium oligosanthes]|uniref:Alpha/beta hydrolase fold-3 domain-containing protein n=1 Tax=Dichanthelium oligosanthes TaxID=888268 RepID=A0A1E5V161_9POAL|nr:hypothetical protein BAE44_0020195 [Dichanthelium oligosanthes]
MSSSPAAPEPYVVEDCRGVMQLMSDGTVRRSTEPAFTVEIQDDADCGVEWKDVTWEPEHGLNARLCRPRLLGAANDARMPVVAYFHGGGFCIGSRRWPSFHACCLRLAAELPAAVLSFDYRLAPEHRLPAAQEDGGKDMSWLQGATRDHPAINPAGPQAPGLEAVEMAPMLVVAGERDVLMERNAEYARRMKEEWGKDVEYVMLAGVEHGFFNRAPWSERADEFVWLVRRFVVEHMMDSE